METDSDTSNKTINQSQQKLGFQKILLAIDNSITSTEIFDQAIDLAEQYQADLMICHCFAEPINSTPELLSMGAINNLYSVEIYELEEQTINAAIEESESWVISLQEKAENKGIHTESRYLIGNTGEEICNLAKNWDADLIVMGRRGLSGFSEMLFGSVSNHVFHYATCAVLVVQHEQ